MTTYGYDNDGRQTLVTEPDPDGPTGPLVSPTTASTYDADGNLITQKDGFGNTTIYGYDHWNRQTSVEDPDTNTTTYTYDLVGNQTSVEDADGHTTSFDYNTLNQLVDQYDDALDVTSYTYDNDGNLLTQTDADGQKRTFDYDHLGRETDEKWIGSDGSTVIYTDAMTYDADGDLLTNADNNSSYAYTYDGLGRQTVVNNSGTLWRGAVVLSSQYDPNGNRTQLAATIGGTADFVNDYAYDFENHLMQVQQHGVTGGNSVAQKSVNLQYTPTGQLQYQQAYNDLAEDNIVADTDYTYDNDGRLTSRTDNLTGTSYDVVLQTYGYDKANRLTSYTHEINYLSPYTLDYAYDPASQLTGVSGSQTDTYDYDATGNRTGDTVSTANEVTYDGTYHYVYDYNGNEILRYDSSGNARVMTYDYRNRLIEVQDYASATITGSDHVSGTLAKDIKYTYDVNNLLISRVVYTGGSSTPSSTTQFVYDNGQTILVFSSTGTATPTLSQRFLNGAMVDQVFAQENVGTSGDAAVYWLLTDNENSTVDLVDDAGELVTGGSYTYSPFGQVLSGTLSLTNVLYTGRYLDEATDLQYNRMAGTTQAQHDG